MNKLLKIIYSIPFSAVLYTISSFHVPHEKQIKQNDEASLIEKILKKYSTQFDFILNNPDKYEVQIIYTQINRDDKNKPSFKQYNYHLNATNYFYPASLVKLPCAALALEKINQLRIKGLNKNTTIYTDSGFVCQKKVKEDTTSFNKKPSVANYIKRMLLISDNDAFGRVYEFLGQEYIYEKLSEKGYKDIRIVHRFDSGCNALANKNTNPVSFYNETGNCIYTQPMQSAKLNFDNPKGSIKRGVAHINSNGKLIKQPKDFTSMNYMTLEDINSILKAIIFPNTTNSKFDLTQEDYTFLYRYLSMYPRESDYPKYDSKKYEDSYKKYFMYGTHHKKIQKDSIRIFNMVGQSYGYLSDCAYIINTERKIEFFLSAAIYVNEDGIINDAKYDYKTVGFPFFTNLGKAIYTHELNREKTFLPDLSNFITR